MIALKSNCGRSICLHALCDLHIYTYFVFHINCDELINSSTRANNKEKKEEEQKLYVLNPCIQRTWHEHGIFVARRSLMMFDCVAMQCTIHLKFNVVSISKLRCHQKIELKRRENGREKKSIVKFEYFRQNAYKSSTENSILPLLLWTYKRWTWSIIQKYWMKWAKKKSTTIEPLSRKLFQVDDDLIWLHETRIIFFFVWQNSWWIK